MRGFGLPAAALTAALAAFAAHPQAAAQTTPQPAAEDRVFVTAQGVMLEAPRLGDMDCDSMRTVLAAIGRSGYRVGAAPRDPADAALRRYEDRLSQRHFATCLQPQSLVADVPTVFADGYAEEEPTP